MEIVSSQSFLENRYKSKHPTSLAKPRTYGEMLQKVPPSGALSWMIAPTEQSDEQVVGSSDPELFSEPEESDHEIENVEGQ